MTFQEEITSKFIAEDKIPAAYSLPEEIDQHEYLVNGEMRQWHGDMHTVVSPVCVVTPDGLQRKVIGKYPVCTVTEAMEALDAAVSAYNHGRGEWPTMSVADRIERVERFTLKMIEQKEIVVKLIMWEIGKSWADSIKEFDRTVEYIYATIDALKAWIGKAAVLRWSRAL